MSDDRFSSNKVLVSFSKLSQILIFGILVFAIGCGGNHDSPETNRSVNVRLVHSPEVSGYLRSLTEEFSLNHSRLPDGRSISIELVAESGLVAAQRIATGELKAEAWLAPSSTLVRLANISLRNLGPRQSDCTALFTTPLVVAVAPQQASFFSPTGGEFSWSRALDLNPESFSRLQRRVSLSYASPFSSAIGFSSVLEMATLVNHGDLSVSSAQDENLRKSLSTLQELVASYPPNDRYLLSRVVKRSGKRVRFALTTEQQVFQHNQQQGGLSPSLVALYPEEGSLFNDANLCISEADWVTPARRAALKLLRDFLTSEDAQRNALELGFRPLVSGNLLESSPAQGLGIDFSLPKTVLPPPAGEAVQAILGLWQRTVRPGAVVLVLDHSGSMEGEGLAVAKDMFRRLVAKAHQRDVFALVGFSTKAKIVSEFSSDKVQTSKGLDKIQSFGGSAVYDGVRQAFALFEQPEIQRLRKTVIVFTDGGDKNSESSLAATTRMLNELSSRSEINFVIIALERDASSFQDLSQLAQAGDGILVKGSLNEMEDIFKDIERSL